MLRDIAPQALLYNPVWSDFIDVGNYVLQANIDAPIEQLRDIRDISQATDPEIIRRTCRLLGFDVSNDVFNLNANTLLKVVSQLPYYPDQNGTENFHKFVDLVLNAVTEVHNLYTKDYVNFLRVLVNGSPPGVLVQDGGEWFKTTHVELRIYIPEATSLNVGLGAEMFRKAVEVFYSLAPISLVVDRTTYVARFDIQDWVQQFGFSISAIQTDVVLTLE